LKGNLLFYDVHFSFELIIAYFEKMLNIHIVSKIQYLLTNIQKYKSNDLLKSTGVVLMGNIVNKGILYGIYFFVAQYFNVENYGVLMLCLIFSSTLSSISNFTINASVTRYSALLVKENKNNYINKDFQTFISTFLINTLATGALLSLITYVFANQIASLLQIEAYTELVQIASIGIFSSLLLVFFQSLYTGLQMFKSLALVNIIPNLVICIGIAIAFILEKILDFTTTLML
jgi:O-antigen/teichoic acid export membrane protein